MCHVGETSVKLYLYDVIICHIWSTYQKILVCSHSVCVALDTKTQPKLDLPREPWLKLDELGIRKWFWLKTWWANEKETRNRTSKAVLVVRPWPVSSWPFTIFSLPNSMVSWYFVGKYLITMLERGWASSRGKFKFTGHCLYHRNLAWRCYWRFCYLAWRLLLF